MDYGRMLKICDPTETLPPLGCNLLYPFGLYDSKNGAVFDLAAYRVALGRMKQAGYHYVEYSHLEHIGAEEFHTLADATRQAGLLPWSVHASGQSPNQGNFARWLEQTIREVHNAHALGCRVLVLHIGTAVPDAEWEPQYAICVAALKAVCKAAANLGIYIGIENINSRVDRLIAIAEAIPAENLGFVLDTGHANLYGSAAEVAARMGRRLFSTHLHDNFGVQDEHLPPGIGLINWPDVLQTLRRIGYSGPFMLELTDYPRNREYDQRVELQQGQLNISTFWRIHEKPSNQGG